MKNHRKNIIFALVGITFFIVFCLVIFNFNKSEKVNSDHSNGDVDINFAYGRMIELKNILPVSDQVGKEFDGSSNGSGIQGYLEFSIKSKVKDTLKYQVYITKKDVDEREISGNYIKFYLTDFEDRAFDGFKLNKLPTFDELVVINDKPESKLLYTGELESLEEEKFILRSWVSDSYAVGSYLEVFNYTIGVKII